MRSILAFALATLAIPAFAAPVLEVTLFDEAPVTVTCSSTPTRIESNDWPNTSHRAAVVLRCNDGGDKVVGRLLMDDARYVAIKNSKEGPAKSVTLPPAKVHAEQHFTLDSDSDDTLSVAADPTRPILTIHRTL
ncbi:uncharacterized protein NMK_2480 [Novimethylophilus kurashikiensis]|uniref:Secreted protein n=1 Tax=Novimethylophilus kurashikiensis TaxID=1825523 RepID=A0A2R5FAN2_9PROT|nr:hypothetical protein [Novimethylophilus kurashikiensis]GBG14879.1 uncharacterized protein NMK_2480 [Novimethylophilus kurashikiensis]